MLIRLQLPGFPACLRLALTQATTEWGDHSRSHMSGGTQLTNSSWLVEGAVQSGRSFVEMESGDTSRTSITLIDRLKQQDDEAWRRLVFLYGPMVHHWGCKAGLSEDDASDVGQEVFRSVLRSIGDFCRDRPGDTFRGWLFVITRNTIRKNYAKTGREFFGVGGTQHQQLLANVAMESDDDSVVEVTSAETASLYRRAMELIKTDFQVQTWTAFVRTVIDEQPVAEVANETGMTQVAVRKAKSRVLQRLRAELGEVMNN